MATLYQCDRCGTSTDDIEELRTMAIGKPYRPEIGATMAELQYDLCEACVRHVVGEVTSEGPRRLPMPDLFERAAGWREPGEDPSRTEAEAHGGRRYAELLRKDHDLADCQDPDCCATAAPAPINEAARRYVEQYGLCEHAWYTKKGKGARCVKCTLEVPLRALSNSEGS